MAIKTPSNPAAKNEGRILHIMKLMRSLEFQTGVTFRELAKAWKLHPDSVKRLTAEASRRVRAEVADHDHVTATVGTALQTAILNAMQNRDYRYVAQMGKAWADITGASAPLRKEVKHTVDLPDDREGLMRLIKTELAREGMELKGEDIKLLAAESGGDMAEIVDAELVEELSE